MTDILKHSEYRDWLHNLKRQIKTGQIKAALSVNSQMIMLYWDLGRQIVEKQENAKWGSGFIEQLSKDLREEFPEMTGFSAKNLRTMRVFYQFYSQTNQPIYQIEKQFDVLLPVTGFEKSEQVVQVTQQIDNQQDIIWKQLVSKLYSIPWGHHIKIMQKVKDIKDDHDKPTIGMLLCKNKDNYEVEFSLKDINNPIGVSTFHYTELSDDMKAVLPSAEELQNELLIIEREFETK